ncbi:MAG: response regulator [Tepidimonas sp.]|nr:response regulator [Tepidimonas sp.]
MPTFDSASVGTVYLVDDEAAVREALTFLFTAHGLQTVALASGPALLQTLATPPQWPACIVLDVRMEPMSGLQVFEALQRLDGSPPVVFLSGHGDIAMAVDAIKRGAFDFVEKPFHDATLMERVHKALAFSLEVAQHQRDARSLRARLEALSPREREVMVRVAAGKLNKVIADELDIAMRTVEVHRSRVFAKLGVRSAAELATLLARASA